MQISALLFVTKSFNGVFSISDEWALGVGDGRGSLVCCSPWIAKSRRWLSDWPELKAPVSSILPAELTPWSPEAPFVLIQHSTLQTRNSFPHWDPGTVGSAHKRQGSEAFPGQDPPGQGGICETPCHKTCALCSCCSVPVVIDGCPTWFGNSTVLSVT